MKGNPNHPKKGSTIAVEPIRRPQDIASIKKLLAAQPRDLLLFTIGINSSLRIGDILQLKVGEVKHLRIGDALTVREQRSGKESVFVMKNGIHKALRTYLKQQSEACDGDYLFRSRKGRNRPLTIGSVNALVKSWTRAINLPGNYGAHSLRKTFGYIQRVHYGMGLDVLARQFNHSCSSVTRRYLGIDGKETTATIMIDI